jgi:rhodanese-related sulfurtransferase
MRIRSTAVQIIILVIAAAAIAVIANGFASRERRLNLPGYWPNARRVPPRVPETVPPPPITTATVAETATVAVAPPVIPTTTTTAEQKPVMPVPPAVKPEVKPPAPPADPMARFTPHPDKAYVEINGDDVAALHKAGALFLDARRTSVFEEGHIAGARSFSVWESDIDDKVNALFNERNDPRDQNLPIVIYCSGGACEDSHMLAQKLWGIQFNNVYVYKDGFPDWQKRGGAVRTGSNP